MMEVSEGVKENTVTFVQVLTVADVAEAAALAVAELGQNQLNQNGGNQVMQIVTMQAPVEMAGSIVTEEQVVTTATTNSTTTPATMAESNPSNQITITSIPVNNDNDGSNDDRLCLICGDRANGVHYNVLSCEGCKSFFLRSNRSGATFTCQQGGNCNMDLYTRRHCPACRMKKCLAYGMKVERVWDKDRLKTRKPLIRMKRKRKQPKQPAETQTSSTLPPPSPAVQTFPTTSMQAPPTPSAQATHTQSLTPALAQPTVTGASGTTTPSSSRSNSPEQQTGPVSVTAVVTPPTATPVAIFKTDDAALSTNPQVLLGDNQVGMLPADPTDPSGTSTQTLLTISPAYPQLTAAQEQLMSTLEKGYKASTEVLKHLSKDVPLFRMTHWSKLKCSDNSPSTSTETSDDDDDEEEDETEPKKLKPATEPVGANTNSESLPSVTAAAGAVLTASLDSDPLAILSAATGQSTDTIYKLTSLATGGQITDPASALNVLVSSEQGMRVIQTIGTMVQGQDLNTLISLATLVGQIIGTGGGMLNDTIADTILGGIMGSIRNNAPEASGAISFPGQAMQNTTSAASSSSSSGDQNGNKDSQSSQDDLAAFAQLASSGLAEALAMLAAMASSSQNKETIVEMVKRAAVSLLKGKGDQHMSMALPSASASSSNFYMPTDVGEEEVKMSPFLQSLQKVTSFLTSGKMSAENQSKINAKRTVNKEMLHIAMDMFAVLVKQTIHFAKSIPGFTNLSCDDQAVLIKSSIVDALLLRCADSYALDKDCLVNDTNGDKFDVHMMYQLGFSTLPEVVFEFMRDTKACGLTTAEYALFTAAALLSPDRSDLKDRGTVEEMQLEMILTLQSATKVFHPDRPFLFTKLITKLTTLRDMSILHLSEIMAVKVQEQDLSPLIVELFGLDS